MAVELATALIWTLRIVLPIILFCIYFKLQAPKDEVYPGPTKNQIKRNTLLAHRKAVAEQPCPDSMKTIKRVTQDENPEFFEKAVRAARSRGGASREDRPSREDRRDRGERRERRDREGGERRREAPAERAPEVPSDAGAPQAVPSAVPLGQPELAPEAEKMHLESLLNYVAFNRKDQQRTFLPDEAAPPPPPPKPPKKNEADTAAPPAVVAAREAPAPTVTGDAAKKANDEAQMVLSGAIKFRRVDVAKTLYEQLVEQQVEIQEQTYALMIESCIQGGDLKSASDFLMKMEASGHSPDTELLDKVMELYSQQKGNKKEDKNKSKDDLLPLRTPLKPPSESTMFQLGPAPITINPLKSDGPDFGPLDFGAAEHDSTLPADLDGAAVPAGSEASRTKLSSGASLFVPTFVPNSSFGVGGPPPPPPTGPKPAKTDEDSKENFDANRTSLKATSKPFQPQGMVTFNPHEYTWTVDTSKSADYQEPKKKGEGKGKDKGKSKDKSKEKSKEDTSKSKESQESTKSQGKAKAKAKEKTWKKKT